MQQINLRVTHNGPLVNYKPTESTSVDVYSMDFFISGNRILALKKISEHSDEYDAPTGGLGEPVPEEEPIEELPEDLSMLENITKMTVSKEHLFPEDENLEPISVRESVDTPGAFDLFFHNGVE